MSFFRKPTPLPVTQGGTGNVYNTYGYAIIGNGYSAYLELTPSTSGNVMTSNGTTWTSAPPSGGGSGTVNSGTAYQLAYYAASGTAVSTLGSLGTNGQVLTSGGAGVAPTWTTISAGSQATATALGTVYAKQTTGGGTPYLTAFGYNAGVSTTGAGNTAMGTEALYTNSTASENTAIGYQAGYSNTTGAGNLFGGYQSGYSNTTGAGNVALGDIALRFNTTATDNTAVGYAAGYVNTTGTSITAVGSGSLAANTTGSYNTGLGVGALRYNTTASNNTAVGYQAGYNNTTGLYNSFFGASAGSGNTTGSYNTVIGYSSMTGTNTADKNTLIGYNAGPSTSGSSNTLVGVDTGVNLTSGTLNTFIGRYAGQTCSTGNYGTHMGYATTSSSSSVASELIIVSGPNGGTGKGASTGYIYPNGGGVYQGNNSATWSVTSDQRLKKNIVDNTIGLSAINAIRVRNFEYRLPEEVDSELKPTDAILKTGVQLGVIAQELQQVLPDCVKEESTGVMSVNSDNITWHLINAIKELSAELNALKAKVGA